MEILILNDYWLKRAERNLEARVFVGGEDFRQVELMHRFKTHQESGRITGPGMPCAV